MDAPSHAPLVTDPVTIFLIVLVIILAAPLIFNKLKIPHIIGMIVAGMLVGPYGFNVVANDSSFAVFGQVGLLYLMFLAGLEIDMYHLRLNLRKGLLFGLMTFAVPLTMGIFTSHWLMKLGWITSGLLGAMYASHTLLAYPVAARYGITKTQPVLISVVGTIFAVTGSLLTLAVSVNIYNDGSFEFSKLLWLVFKIILWGAAVIWLYPKITRYFFRLYHDKVTQYVYVLAMVFLASWSAKEIGLEAVLGAFVSGLVFNRFVPSASSLMASIEFVGNALFIPYFLIGVGMIINLGVVMNSNTLMVTGIMLAVAIIGKLLPALIGGKFSGMGGSGAAILFGLTTAHTAVALAVVTIGYNLGLLDATVLNATMLVILVTCAIAPMVTAAAAPKLKLRIINVQEIKNKDIEVSNVLIPVANPQTSRPLLELAILMRKINEDGLAESNLFALHVRTESTNRARNQSNIALESALKIAATANAKLNTLERFDMNITSGVLAAMEERDVNQVILGLHRRQTFIDSYFGNKLEQLLKSTNKMVMISRNFIPFNTLLRVIVWVPAAAQYETGFAAWVGNIGRLANQLGCRVIFCCRFDCQKSISGVLRHEGLKIRHEFRSVASDDEFILLSGHVNYDDLFVVVGARPNSVSYSSSMVETPAFLQRHFGNNNLLMIYPEQFGDESKAMSFADPLASDIVSTTPPWMLKARAFWKNLRRFRRPFSNSSHYNPFDL